MPKRKRTAAQTLEDDTSEKPQPSRKAAKTSDNPFTPYPADKAYRLLEPGPVILISTREPRNRKPNLMTCGFHMVIQHGDPPLVGVIVGPWDHSFAALRASKECVIALPSISMAEKVVDIGNISAENLKENKFIKFGLTAVKASTVKAPLVGEAMACLECRVHDDAMVQKYGLWVLKVVKGWACEDRMKDKTFHHRGEGTFTVDGEVLDLREKMTLWREFQDD